MIAPTLTPRERDLLDLSAAGMTQLDIADELGLTAGTVNDYATQLRRKLGAKTLAHAVALAYQCGLLGSKS